MVNGRNYNKVYITYKEDLDDLRHAYNIREENGKVYICGNSSDTDNPEYLWFDFTLGVGDKITNECAKLDNIDLTLDENYQTQGQKKQMKNELVEVCKKLGLNLTNFTEIRSRRDYNCYKIEYPIQHSSISVKPLLFNFIYSHPLIFL